MEYLSVLLLIVFILIVLNQNGNLKAYLQKLEKDVRRLQHTIDNITIEKQPLSKQPEHKATQEPAAKQNLSPQPGIFTSEQSSSPITEKIAETTEAEKTAEAVKEKINQANIPPAGKKIPPPAKPGFFERNPDLEKFIGENLVSKIGIAILVLAIGYFVKYAIDKDWIGPAGRVGIGIFAGALLIGIAHRLRRSYRAFSSVLAGGGLAVFYFTITLAFHRFHLFGQTAAFVIMTVITVFSVALALLYDKQELAIIALIGGFAAPFLVSTGAGNYRVLFIYLTVLNTGIIAIAYHKAWRLLNLLSFIFTVILYGTWLLNIDYNEPVLTYKNGFIFAAVFYLLFFIINIAYNVREKKKFIASDFGILLANTCLFFAAGLYCIHMSGADHLRGLFSAAMGVFNLAASYFLFRRQKVDSNILYLLIGLTLTFVSITAPLQLHGNHITLFWASEAALLYWLFLKSRIRIVQYSSGIVWVLMLISLFADWLQLYVFHTGTLAVILNRAFVTTLFAAIASYCIFLLRNEEEKQEKISDTNMLPGKKTFRIAALVLLYLSGAFEINYQFSGLYSAEGLNHIWLLLYTAIFVMLLIFISKKIRTAAMSQKAAALLLTIVILLYLISLPNSFGVQKIILEQQHFLHGQFIAHSITAALIASIIYFIIKIIRDLSEEFKKVLTFITWSVCTIVVIFLSAEAMLIANNIFYSRANSLYDIQQVFVKTGLPILWGLCSFGFMWLGMHYKNRTLRIISLSLFTLTLLKLFIFDIQNIPAGGKIAAFFCLGVLLLVVSFMYQRLKKIIIDNEKKDD